MDRRLLAAVALAVAVGSLLVAFPPLLRIAVRFGLVAGGILLLLYVLADVAMPSREETDPVEEAQEAYGRGLIDEEELEARLEEAL